MLLQRTIHAMSVGNAFVCALVLALSTIEFGWRSPTDFILVPRSQFSRSRMLVQVSFISSALGFCAAVICIFCSCFDAHRAHRHILPILCLTMSFIALTTEMLSAGFGVAVLAHRDYESYDELFLIALLNLGSVFMQGVTILLFFNKEIHDHKEYASIETGRRTVY